MEFKNIGYVNKNGILYEVVGKWCGAIVLATNNDASGECLILSENEIKEQLDTGWLIELEDCGFNFKEE